MDIGQTFNFENIEYSIKRIILPGGTDKDGVVYDNGRVDASKFVGEGVWRKLQKGRPKKFDYPFVANLLGDYVEPSDVDSDLTDEDEQAVQNWRGERSDPEKIKSFIEKHYSEEELEVTSDDW